MFSLLQVFVSTRHQKIFLFCSMVIWQKKKTKKQSWKYVSFFWNLSFLRRYVLLFFQRWREQSAVHFFLFWKWWLLIYVTGKKLFWNIFFVFKFRKFRFWFLMLHQCIEREPDDFTYFLLWYVFFWLLMIFFVDKIKFVLLRWCYFKVHIKSHLSLRTKTYARLFSCLKEWNQSNHQTILNKVSYEIVLLILFVTW